MCGLMPVCLCSSSQQDQATNLQVSACLFVVIWLFLMLMSASCGECIVCSCINMESPYSQKLCVQGQLHRAQNSLQEWHNAFQSIAAKSGLPLEPTALLAHLQQTHHQPTTAVTAGSTATEDVNVLKQRESQLQAQLMEKILENMELRRHLQAAKAAAEPNVVQVLDVPRKRFHHDLYTLAATSVFFLPFVILCLVLCFTHGLHH